MIIGDPANIDITGTKITVARNGGVSFIRRSELETRDNLGNARSWKE